MDIDDWTGTQISDEIIEQAAQWVAVLDEQNQLEPSLNAVNTCLDSQNDFHAWLNLNPLNQMAFAQVSEIWAKTACLKQAEHLLNGSQVLAFPKRSIQPKHTDVALFENPNIESAAPPWIYSLTIGVIAFGLTMSVFSFS